MKNIDTSELSVLKPRSKIGDFDIAWPSIKEALNRKLKSKEIYRNLQKNGLSCSYVTFTRWVKLYEQKESKKVPTQEIAQNEIFSKVETSPQQADIQLSENSDKSNSIPSIAGAAFEKATAESKIDYSKIARQAKKTGNT